MRTDLKNRQALEYYKEIDKRIPSSKEKTAILSQLENSLLEFSEENPEAKLEDYELRFGLPQNIAEDFTISVGENELHKKVNKAEFVKKLALLIFLILVIGAVIVFGIVVAWNSISKPKLMDDGFAQIFISMGEFSI